MPAVESWTANPLSEKVAAKTDGAVTAPSTVTTLPSGRWRASLMLIGGATWRAAVERAKTVSKDPASMESPWPAKVGPESARALEVEPPTSILQQTPGLL